MVNSSLLKIGLLTVLAASGPAWAQAPAPGPGDRSGGGAAEFSALTPCDEARFNLAENEISQLAQGDRKSRAAQELAAAREMFRQNEAQACMIHLSSARLWMRH